MSIQPSVQRNAIWADLQKIFPFPLIINIKCLDEHWLDLVINFISKNVPLFRFPFFSDKFHATKLTSDGIFQR